ncbi:putative Protein APCDD1 [Hypsibius exemplaris]|uniref:APCDD1 domain-containing protein n=1 Tax=Hypsibius exemplaris TaxID=2072580 RepID=A0A1W0X1S6_HYPEX|nr:putative Protein APCDD1 [Hypsibius exemplaris]
MWFELVLTGGLLNFVVLGKPADGGIDWNPCDGREMRVTAERPVALSGRWVSHRCEVRTGPKSLLRDYEFGYNTSFTLHQYYYSDDCTTPSYSLTIRGVLNEMKKSWMLPGAVDVDYTVTRITVMPYTQDQAELLQAAVLKICPLARFSAQSWSPFFSQEIFNYDLYPTTPLAGSAESGVSRIDVEFDCLEALNFTFDELYLIRLQRRRWRMPDDPGRHNGTIASRRELYTGETPRVAPADSGQEIHRPVSYLADFLIKTDSEITHCPVCRAIEAARSPSQPPVLRDRKHQPPFLQSELAGQWHSVSECESRPSGSFIRRILTLQPDSAEWQGEYQHYTEPDCQQRSFTILGSGTFTLEEPYALIPSAQKIDFLVVNASVTAHLDFVLQQLTAPNNSDCGLGTWFLNSPKDITPTNGCRLLGLTIPNADFNIVRLERDTFSNGLLFLGQDYQESAVPHPHNSPEHFENSATISLRPTSFQPALLQCPPRTQQRTTLSSSAATASSSSGGGSFSSTSKSLLTAHRRNHAERLKTTFSFIMKLSLFVGVPILLQAVAR